MFDSASIGMALGIAMAISGDHSEMPAHAHINLLGYVSMMLYGLFYKNYPKATEGRLPVIHFWIANVGLIGLAIGVGLIHGGMPEAEPIAAVSSLVAITGMAVFAVVVFRATRTAWAAGPWPRPTAGSGSFMTENSLDRRTGLCDVMPHPCQGLT